MKTEQTQVTGLATAGTSHKLAGYFGISVEVQRRIGTFIVMFTMIEQMLEFVLMNRDEPKPEPREATIPPTLSKRLKVVSEKGVT